LGVNPLDIHLPGRFAFKTENRTLSSFCSALFLSLYLLCRFVGITNP